MPLVTNIIDNLTDDEADAFVSDPVWRTTFLLQSLIKSCQSRRVIRAVIAHLEREGIIKGIDGVDEFMRSIPRDELSESSTEHEADDNTADSELSDDEIPDVDSLLQMEVFNSSAVKNIGRFNCEFLRYEKLGQGGFGCAYRVHHLVDEKDYCVKELHLSIQKFDGSMPQMISYARGVLREVFALSRCEHHENVVAYNNAWAEVVTERAARDRAAASAASA
eukprot:CAMPEP_0172209124 /NCGR_PEP_ID=MMETSP1050-20130122/34909_1 /TAXON_ID=233186 /ORGANISM="Cryptomonas curvata, Strain CCAP979/52" /LENGTH=220 /DNA_ID=CAMNT_0012888903 /DNA_START=65 /DNA_END=724 /DNA_ORIENTATION=-